MAGGDSGAVIFTETSKAAHQNQLTVLTFVFFPYVEDCNKLRLRRLYSSMNAQQAEKIMDEISSLVRCLKKIYET